jgi:hypothetical protein
MQKPGMKSSGVAFLVAARFADLIGSDRFTATISIRQRQATARLFVAEGALVAITGRDQKTLDQAVA